MAVKETAGGLLLVGRKPGLAGCHLNRDTLGSIQAAGFETGALDRFVPPGPFTGLVPHVQGWAVAP
jgi:hypothetical protein